MSNIQTQPRRPKFSVAIQTNTYKNLINNTLTDPKRASRFIATISSAVAINPTLQECDAGTILSGALVGEALNLSPSPQLGQYFLVPYKKKDRDGNVSLTAQFQLGYKGYIQLAIRSGQYRKLNVMAIKEGELVRFDPMTEEIEVNLIEDDLKREATKTIGYYAMFEYQNGFRKALYWSFEKMLAHANKYSQAFSADTYKLILDGKINEKDMWKYSSFWYKDFDGMAFKTMLRQLISKWGIMSIEMQTAFENDMGVVSQDGTINYVDNEPLENDVVADAEVVTDQSEAEEVDIRDL